MAREDRKADFFSLSTLGGSESRISLPERHHAGQCVGLQEAPGEPRGSPTPETWAKVAGQEEDGRSYLQCSARGNEKPGPQRPGSF